MSKKYSAQEILQARHELWRQGDLKFKLSPTQARMYDFWDSVNNKESGKTSVINAGRRVGKCIEENVEVMTPNGPVPIKDLKAGDVVYGFNKDGSVSETTVVAHDYQGFKEVVDITNNGRKVASSTLDHIWGVVDPRYPENYKEDQLKNCTKKNKAIIRREVCIPGGNLSVPQAYSIGVLLGDGYAINAKNRIFVSSQEESIVKQAANETNRYYQKNISNNFTWTLKTNNVRGKHSNEINIPYYNEWILNKKAHEKIIDLKELKRWDRASQLKLLAGLIDTDGSVGLYNNNLNIQFYSQSKSIIDAFQYLFLALFQYKPTIVIDKRNKYKNGGLYKIGIKHNYICKKAIKELDKYIQCDRKKYKTIYNTIKINNFNPKYIGFKVSEPYKAHTYDIQVDNDTNLYLTAEGLVTHNTYFLTILALEQCIKNPKSTVKFLQPEKGQVKTNVLPVMSKILEDCPIDLRPEWKSQSSSYEFPNGSRIQLGGTDRGNHEKFRGDDAHLCLIDEAGFLQAPLGYIIRSILAPATMRTFGKIILSSSTPTDPSHEFVGYMESSTLRGTFFDVTTKHSLEEHEKVNDKRFTREMYEHLVEEYPLGEADEEFRRECLNELITDGTNSVVPEFTKEVEESTVVEWKRPPFCDKYVSMDIGFKDLTVVLFAYYDFINGVTVVEDEIVINGPKMTTQLLAEEIKKKEEELWRNPLTNETEDPYMRVCDNDLILINDMHSLHNLSFLATSKDNKEAQINNLRMEIAGYKIYINPKCTTLIHHLKHATWDKRRRSYTRSPDSGHYDAVDALIYLIRNIQKNHNPYPPGYNLQQLGASSDVFVRPNYQENTDNYDNFKDLFSVKRRTKKRS